MAELIITHRQKDYLLKMPYQVIINGKTIDMTLSATETIMVSDEGYNCLDFKDKERWWDIVFGIDLAAWFVVLFLTIPHPWNIVYHVLSDGFFVAWLIRLFFVRKRYYTLSVYTTTVPPSVFRRWFEPEAEKITLPSGRYELTAEAHPTPWQRLMRHLAPIV